MPTRFLLLLTAATLLTAPSAAAQTGDLRGRLHVYADVPREVLELAKATAVQILGEAGVPLTWAECPARQNEGHDAACQRPLTRSDLQLRIIDKPMARRTHRRSTCMGYAMVASSIASAFYHKAVDLERGDLAKRGAILGSILAHEIGHVLDVGEHSQQGIMRASWSGDDLRFIAQGRFAFRKEESQRMRAALASRLSQAVAAAARSTP